MWHTVCKTGEQRFGLLLSTASPLLLFVFVLGKKKNGSCYCIFLSLMLLSASPVSFLSPFFPYYFWGLLYEIRTISAALGFLVTGECVGKEVAGRH